MTDILGALFADLGVAPGAFALGILLLLGLVSRIGGNRRRTD